MSIYLEAARREEVRDLRDRLREYAGDLPQQIHEDLREAADRIAALTAERDALLPDAERYWWLRNNWYMFGAEDYPTPKRFGGKEYYATLDATLKVQSGPELNAAIDAARAAKEGT